MANKSQAAQNQHYVPKHILRNFLSNPDKEQVTVFDKKTQKTFTPNIAGIMAERRFNEFVIEEEWLASFEPAVSRIEDQVLPVYRDIVEHRRLTGTPEERGLLAFLIAFQMVRTKAQRNTFLQMDQMLRDKWDKLGIERHDIGQLDQNPDELKIRHAEFMEHSLKEFTQIIGGKQFLLMEAAKGRSFYLGDNPVVLHNETKPDHFFGATSDWQ